MIPLSYRSKTIALINSVHFSGGPGVGAYQLIVRPTISMQPAKSPSSTAILALRGVLRLGRAVPTPDTLPVIAPLQGKFVELRCVEDQSIPHTPVLSAMLSGSEVRALDQARVDGDLDVVVEFDAQVTGGEGPLPTSFSYPAQITGSDWKRILREMKFEDRATFEVPVDGDRIAAPFGPAAKHMRDALDQVQKRDWKDALTACREVLDELAKHQRVSTPPLTDWGTKHTAWGIPERVVAMQEAVRHLTHAGAHAKIGNADEHEVRLAVAMTGALLRYYASR